MGVMDLFFRAIISFPYITPHFTTVPPFLLKYPEEVKKMLNLRSKKGFTLVEIMIVVAIIALLAAIAIPNLLRARHNANEAAAISSMKTLATAMESFRAAQTPASYPANLAALSGANPPYVDVTLTNASAAANPRQGYGFSYTSGVNTYNVRGNPATANVTGTRSFFVDQSGVIRANSAGDAIVTSLPIE